MMQTLDEIFMEENNERQTSLSKLVGKLKGDMNISQFSNITGLNISTISRIIGGKIIRPIAEDSLKKLAAFAQDRSDITFEMLQEANDKVSQETKSLYYGSNHKIHNQLKAEEQCIKQIIVSDIILPRYEIWWNHNPETLIFDSGIRIIPDLLALFKDTRDKNKVEKKWVFEIKIGPLGTAQLGNRLYLQTIIDTVSRYTFWTIQNDKNKGMFHQISVVVSNQLLFDRIEEKMKDFITILPTSIILVSTERNKIEKELILKNTGNYKVQSVFERVVR